MNKLRIPFSSIPIKTRLALGFASVSIVFLFLYSLIVYTVFERYLTRDALETVRVQYETIISDIEFTQNEANGLDLAERTLSRIDQATNLGLLVFVYDQNGEAIVSPSPIAMPLDKNGPFEVSQNGETFYVYGGTLPNNAYLFVATSKEVSVNEKLRTLSGILLLVGLSAVALLFVFSYFFSRQALRPLDRLKAYIAEGRTGPEHFAKDEIGYLAVEFDRYRNRIEESLAREREFSADASHELRTPLTVLRTTLELLEPKIADAASKEKVATMHASIDEMEELTNKLLLLERGLGDGKKHPIGLTGFFREYLTQFEPIAEKKGLALDFVAPKTEAVVLSSRERLEHVFGNLLRNAIRYTENGTIAVRVHGDRVDVSDTGPGIPPDELYRIWDRFYRSSKARTGNGAGLGLSIVKRLADEAGWQLGVTSKVGKGTTFTVVFPNDRKKPRK